MADRSRDPVNEQANLWLTDQKVKEVRRPQAAKVQALAHELHVDPEELAKRIPADTLRRLKFPMIEQRSDDGTTVFKHDLGIMKGVRPNLGIDRAYEDIPKTKGDKK